MATLGGQLVRSAAAYPEQAALIYEGTERNYRDLNREVNQHAHALASLGVSKGDRVALISANSDLFIVAMYAVFKLGAIFVPINPRSASRELRHMLCDSGAVVLLAGDGLAPVVHGLNSLDPLPHTVTSLALAELPGLESLRSLAATMPTSEPLVEVVEDDDAIIMYTSGTTGMPKGALFDHHRMIWVGNTVTSVGLNTFDKQLHVAPMYHCAELALFVLTGFSLGTTHVVLPAFDPAKVVRTVAEQGITTFLAVPTMFQMMLALTDLDSYDFSAFRLGFFGAAPMPASAVEKLVKAFPGTDFIQLCGQTEGGPGGIYSGPDEVVARPDATGRYPTPNSEVLIVNLDGEETADDEHGEMIIRGETVMKEYWNNPQATAQTLRNGWLHTGDIAVRDADGYITMVDRMKDMIITGGQNVYSVEVENALAAHPKVVELAVIGRPHETFGETVVAVVRTVEGADLTLAELREFGAAYISDYKLPRVLLLRDIPRNPSGKILKHVLREETMAD